MYLLSRLVTTGCRDSATSGSLSGNALTVMARLITNYSVASGWRLTPTEFLALPFEMARAPLFPIVAAVIDPMRPVAETLIFAPHLQMVQRLVGHASHVARSSSGLLRRAVEVLLRKLQECNTGLNEPAEMWINRQ